MLGGGGGVVGRTLAYIVMEGREIVHVLHHPHAHSLFRLITTQGGNMGPSGLKLGPVLSTQFPEVQGFISKCISYEPEERLTSVEVCEFLEGVVGRVETDHDLTHYGLGLERIDHDREAVQEAYKVAEQKTFGKAEFESTKMDVEHNMKVWRADWSTAMENTGENGGVLFKGSCALPHPPVAVLRAIELQDEEEDLGDGDGGGGDDDGLAVTSVGGTVVVPAQAGAEEDQSIHKDENDLPLVLRRTSYFHADRWMAVDWGFWCSKRDASALRMVRKIGEDIVVIYESFSQDEERKRDWHNRHVPPSWEGASSVSLRVGGGGAGGRGGGVLGGGGVTGLFSNLLVVE